MCTVNRHGATVVLVPPREMLEFRHFFKNVQCTKFTRSLPDTINLGSVSFASPRGRVVLASGARTAMVVEKKE